MALEIEGYTYITHKLINRPWGPECRYTVARPDGTHINDVVPVSSMKIEEMELVTVIVERLKGIDVEPLPPPPDPMIKMVDDAVAAKEAEIKAILVSKELLTKDEEITDIKSKTEIISASEVKP
jgi:hypothetical protein